MEARFDGQNRVADHLPPGIRGVFYAAPPRVSADVPSPLTLLLHRFKYGADRRAGRVLAALFAKAVASHPFDPATRIVPVPADPDRLAQRGYNPAAWLARAAARRTALRMDPALLCRLPGGAAQHGLNLERRRNNLAGLFSAAVPAGRLPRRVLLIDDVMTTGATLTACAAALQARGIQHIKAAVLLYADRFAP